MLKRLGYVFLAFLVLVILDYVITTAASLGSILLPSILASAIGGPYYSASAGLSAVNFNLFAKGGKGWNYITQGYGVTPYSYLYINHWHNGVDIAANYGAPIYSPDDGTVIATGDQDDYCPGKAFGKFVAVKDPARNIVLLYAHLGNILVSPGDTIKIGDEIATIGSSGLETGAHLHFSVFEAPTFATNVEHGCGPYPDGKDVNPIPYLQSFAQ